MTMDPLTHQIIARIGDEVHSSDEHKMGKVLGIDKRFLTVQRGLIGKKQYFIPMSAVDTCAGGKVYLNLTKAQADLADWETPPVVETGAENPPIAL